ncbi:MAG: pyruvate dehydrogenase (acetyl-transferring), homodimeric type, partial [Halothiobacillus sp.]|nr:pyruvate dehydrogenase (acetyl-transferring), homodimeric type [Halothiobacillus sp.]
RLHPDQPAQIPYLTQTLAPTKGPIIAATDYIHLYTEQVRAFMPRRYVTLGTDGFGRSDTREALRRFFEVDAAHVVVAALKALVDEGTLPAQVVNDAIGRYGIDASLAMPSAR